VTDAGRRPLGGLIGLLEGEGMLRNVLPGGATAPGAVQVSSVVLDSRAAGPGSLFAAVSGPRSDGADFVADAVARGAVAVISERAMARLPVPQLLVHAVRPALSLAAAWFHDFPSAQLGVVGVTGTDGKTTTSYLVRAMLEASGRPTGLVGTIDVIVGGRSFGNPSRVTTPEAPELHGWLARMVEAGDRFAMVESTSHALEQDRLTTIAYDVAVLTNVTQDHLEFHGTPQAYRRAKRRLFESLAVGPHNPEKGFGKHAVLNADDAMAADYGRAAADAGAMVITYGADATADVRPTGVREDSSGLRFEVVTPRWNGEVALRLAGRFNVHNALAAIAVGEALELDPEAIRSGLGALERVPGRMQSIDAGQPFRVIIDYAHTGDALTTVHDALAPLAAAGGGGLIAVFGAAGGRDHAKRPVMGRVAAERCRLVVLTDEDPLNEDPEAIVEEIAAGAEAGGMRRGQNLLVIMDRREAIARALSSARPADVVVLTGKGHEKTFQLADGESPWDEATVVREELAVLGYTAGS
jgi:UDP-N-acetylmuramoyl-L-alanyl-D-glutamate--2,6-diaminopimelate ligase